MTNIRSVTTNPPTMLIVASATATRLSARIGVESAVPATRIAPTRITPWMALAPDISGVCRVEDTLEMTSIPTKTASTKIVSQMTASLIGAPLSGSPGGLAGRRRGGTSPLVEFSGPEAHGATISSSKSGANSPSRVISSITLTTFWAYSRLAGPGIWLGTFAPPQS